MSEFDSWFDSFYDKTAKGLEAPADPLAPHREAIAGIESGGDYSKIGPVTKTGDRALGKYQVMAKNLPEWSKAALGRELTPKEFLASREAQDAIFNHRFGGYLQEHGPADAASMWFTGKPLAEGAKLKDQLGTSGEGYVKKYLANLGGTPTVVGKVEFGPEVKEFLDTEYPRAPAAAARPVQEVPARLPSWGALQNVGSEALFGTGPNLSAAAQAGREAFRDILSGTSPGDAIKLAQDVYYPQAKSQYRQAQESWGQENPGTELATKIAGQSLPMLAGVGAASAGLRGLGALAPRVAPAMEFLTGAGARNVGGVGGMAARGLGDVATGAWQGALGNTIVGEDPTQGALWGGGLGPVAGGMARTFLTPERATMRPEVAQAAKDYLAQGGELPASALAGSPGTKRMLEALSGKGDVSSVENFNSKLADLVGAKGIMEAEGVKGLSPSVMAQNWSRLDTEFNNFAAQRGVNIDKTLIQDRSEERRVGKECRSRWSPYH